MNSSPKESNGKPVRASTFRYVRLRFIGPVIVLGTLTSAVLIWINQEYRGPGQAAADPAMDAALLAEAIESSRVALGDGRFQSAVDHLDRARILSLRHQSLLTPRDAKALESLEKQARLLSDLLPESLEEILKRSDSADAGEAQAVFARNYREKAVVFYATVRRDSAGRYHLDYQLQGGRRPARLLLDGLLLLRSIPMQEPQRLLFGFRLAALERGPDGSWQISVLPESGVLLTEPAAAAACFQTPEDGQLNQVIKRQTAWQESW